MAGGFCLNMSTMTSICRVVAGLLAASAALCTGCASAPPRPAARFPPVPHYPSDHQYTLDELIALSIFQNPTLEAARNSAEAAQGLVDQVKSLWLPQVRYDFLAAAYDNDLNYKVRALGLVSINVPLTSAYNINNTASLAQIITTSGKRTSALKQVRMLAEIERLQVLALQDCIAFDVASLYYLVCLTNDIDAVLEDTLRRVRVFRKVSAGLNRRGSFKATVMNTQQADFLIHQIEQLRIVDQSARYQTYQALRTFTGVRYEQVLQLKGVSLSPVLTQEVLFNRAAAIAKGFLRRPEIRQVDLLAQLFREQVNFVKRNYLPNAGFLGAATSTTGNSHSILNSVSGLIGVIAIDVPIYDPAQKGRLRTALGLERASKAIQQQVEDLITLEIDSSRTGVQTSLAAALKAIQGRQVAAAQYHTSRQAFSRDMALATDVIIAMSLDMLAKLEYLQTLYSYHCAQARLKRVTADWEIRYVPQ